MENSTLESVFDLNKIRQNWDSRRSALSAPSKPIEVPNALSILKALKHELGQIASSETISPLLKLLEERLALPLEDPQGFLQLIDQLEEFLEIEFFWKEWNKK